MRRGRTLVNVLLPAAVLVLALLFRILYICAILSSVGFRHSDKDVSHPKDFDQNFISSFGTRFNLRKRQISSNRPLRFLWGIMTTESDLDRRQRQAIRDTYLSYYKSDKENKHRICSITDLINDRIPGDFCQIAYTFVVGAKPDGNPGLLEPFVDQDFNEELTTMPVDLSAVEDDVTYLNIKENMNKGKMYVCFKMRTLGFCTSKTIFSRQPVVLFSG